MNVTYNRETDSLLIVLRDVPTRESDAVSSGVIAAFDEAGDVIRFEFLDASRVVDETDGVQLQRRAEGPGHTGVHPIAPSLAIVAC